jgi:hypothetical protein
MVKYKNIVYFYNLCNATTEVALDDVTMTVYQSCEDGGRM